MSYKRAVVTVFMVIRLSVSWADIYSYSSKDIQDASISFFVKQVLVSQSNRRLKRYCPDIYKEQYQTIGVYDGGFSYSFFLPLKAQHTDYLWWDSGTVLSGSGLVYRRVLSQPNDQNDWFVGLYGYYDVMAEVMQECTPLIWPYLTDPSQRCSIRKHLLSRLHYPVRWSLGCELGELGGGHITLTGYAMLPKDVRPDCTARMQVGISARASIHLNAVLQPFICGSVSYLERKPGMREEGFSWAGLRGIQHFKSERIKSAAIGVKWLARPNYVVEMKYFFCNDKNYHLWFHLGCKIKRAPVDSSYHLKYCLEQPPERYIPYYPHAIRLRYGY